MSRADLQNVADRGNVAQPVCPNDVIQVGHDVKPRDQHYDRAVADRGVGPFLEGSTESLPACRNQDRCMSTSFWQLWLPCCLLPPNAAASAPAQTGTSRRRLQPDVSQPCGNEPRSHHGPAETPHQSADPSQGSLGRKQTADRESRRCLAQALDVCRVRDLVQSGPPRLPLGLSGSRS